jgi:UDP-glucuronate 4-epimerase
MSILVTGAAGFIGSNIMRRLAEQGEEVVGIDNINDYYDPALKYGRLAACGFQRDSVEWEGNISVSSTLPTCRFIRMDISDGEAMNCLFGRYHFTQVVNLAAQAGVRYSLSHPYDYMRSNLDGFLNVLECCRHNQVQKLVFASSSSVYGLNSKTPFCEDDVTESPVSLYAASKKSDELMAFSYCKLYGLKAVGLRYFTVYGPWGRPDMAPSLFAHALVHGETIRLFNRGDMIRDFTYIDDIVDGTLAVLGADQQPDDHGVSFTVYNIGSSHPVRLLDFLGTMERAFGRKAKTELLPMQPGDVYATYADTTKLAHDTGFRPRVSFEEGISRFAQWYTSARNPLESSDKVECRMMNVE